MEILAAIVEAFSSLLAFLTGRQQVQHDEMEQQAGKQSEIILNQKAEVQAERKMGEALAETPKTKEDLDNDLGQGKF